MSKTEIQLCSLLLEEKFGDIVQAVGTYLLKEGPRALRSIVRDVKCPIGEMKKALSVLLQHNLAVFVIRDKGIIEYQVLYTKVLLLARYPRYIYSTKTLYNDVGELLIEEFLFNGQLTMSNAIKNVIDRVDEASGVSPQDVKDKFISLVQTHFIQRCPEIITEGTEHSNLAPTLQINHDYLNLVPEIRIDLLKPLKDEDQDLNPPPNKKHKPNDEIKYPDLGIYWAVNFERFHQLFRDQAVVNLVTARTDQIGGDIIRTLLRLSEVKTPPNAPTTNQVSRYEILGALTRDTSVLEENIDPYLSILTNDCTGCISKSDDRSGGMYVINFNHSIKAIAEGIVTSIVQDRFGSKCCRIFRLLLQKKYLDQKQIEEMSMIPAKDAKEHTYKMIKENFIATREIAKTPDHAPSQTFYLFYIELDQLCRMVLEFCYQALQNIIRRRYFETQEHKRLLEKKQRVDAIIANLQRSEVDSTQIQEVEELITPPEKEQLIKIQKITKKLDESEMQLDETVFLLHSFIYGEKQ